MRISDWSSDVCSSDLASKVAWNDEMRTLQPGESLVYQFQAKHAGMWMYHCGTAPALHHIGNGMFGAIIIDPPDLPAVDHAFVIVQSELSLGAEGGVGDLGQMKDRKRVVSGRSVTVRVDCGGRRLHKTQQQSYHQSIILHIT